MKLERLLDRAIVKPRASGGSTLLDSVQANVCEAERANIKVLCSKSAGLSYKLSELNVVVLGNAGVSALVDNE
ncbi:10 kDa chaperonin [Candidatus Hodgkinia cicadicola]|nr:10 kDa chaperonin [Candidatus Hodgkinia cicadicola]